MLDSTGLRFDLQEVGEALAVSANAFGEALRALSRSDDLTVGGRWTVRHTAVHTIGCLKLYRNVLGGLSSAIRGLGDLDVLNEAWFLMLEEGRPTVLADLVAAGWPTSS
jgi:hypothetical protein